MTNEPTRERLERALGVLKSDGYHTFYELYEHRTALFAALCNTYNDRSWKSFKHADGTMYDGMFIAGIETPEGQYTYHCEEEYLYMFAMTKEIPNAPEWDGHKPSDYSRLFALNLKEGYRPEREPCDWCEAQMQNVMGYVQYGCLRLDASCWNFCPVCGRKLEKAVPEFESRVISDGSQIRDKQCRVQRRQQFKRHGRLGAKARYRRFKGLQERRQS